MSKMTKLILEIALKRAKEYEQIMKAIEAAHKVYPKRRSKS